MAGPFMIIAWVRSVYRIRDYRAFQIHRYCHGAVIYKFHFFCLGLSHWPFNMSGHIIHT